MQPTIDTDELARWLGYASGPKFQNAAPALIKSHGFPRKLPGVKCWSRKAVLQWIDRQGGVDPAMAISGAPLLDPEDHDLEALRRDIEARYLEAAE
ncbi:MAG: hypothetical protein CMF72_22735 [Mameliella sp.]|nr:hypothetical protein [Mameliella sp.]|tara:strand:- start:479 stop:766 length:288 start_codon:yes stop_codon:yes gene_type:complete